MDIIFANGRNSDWACQELMDGLRKAGPVIDHVVNKFRSHSDSRTLVVVKGCPCCDRGARNFPHIDGGGQEKDLVIVSPYHGIDDTGYKIKTIGFYPPFRNPGENRECQDLDQFASEWEKIIRDALVLEPVKAV